MVAQDCPPEPKIPEFNPNIYPMNPWTHYDGLQSAPMASWGGNVWAGRGRAKGRGGPVGVRGTLGYGRGAPGVGRGPRGVCWVCYQPGHWARDCPQQPQIQQHMGPPQGGRGGPPLPPSGSKPTHDPRTKTPNADLGGRLGQPGLAAVTHPTGRPSRGGKGRPLTLTDGEWTDSAVPC